MNGDAELLNFIYQNSQMGVETLGRRTAELYLSKFTDGSRNSGTTDSHGERFSGISETGRRTETRI